MYHRFHKNSKSNTVVIDIDNKQKCFIRSDIYDNISILEWFMKDRVTLKTEVIAVGNSKFSSQE